MLVFVEQPESTHFIKSTILLVNDTVDALQGMGDSNQLWVDHQDEHEDCDITNPGSSVPHEGWEELVNLICIEQQSVKPK